MSGLDCTHESGAGTPEDCTSDPNDTLKLVAERRDDSGLAVEGRDHPVRVEYTENPSLHELGPEEHVPTV